MPILGQDTSVLLCSPHRPWEVVRTYHSFSETDYQSIILLFHFGVKDPRKSWVSEVALVTHWQI